MRKQLFTHYALRITNYVLHITYHAISHLPQANRQFSSDNDFQAVDVTANSFIFPPLDEIPEFRRKQRKAGVGFFCTIVFEQVVFVATINRICDLDDDEHRLAMNTEDCANVGRE